MQPGIAEKRPAHRELEAVRSSTCIIHNLHQGFAEMSQIQIKKQFFFQLDWKNKLSAAILYLLFFFAVFCCALFADSSESLALTEMRMAREAMEREKLQLSNELAETKKELDRVRSLYADKLIEQSRLMDRLLDQELAAENLLQGGEEHEIEKRFSEAMQVMALVRRRILEVEAEFSLFERFMAAALDGLQPSDAMRHEVEQRVVSLRRVIESSLNPLSLVAGRGNGDAEQPGCMVLSLDEETQSVYLNRGFQHGLRSGIVFVLERAGKTLAEVRLVECRPDTSAAILSQGNWAALMPGAELKVKR